jgi:succinyl-diaminopimelate desuccinylase
MTTAYFLEVGLMELEELIDQMKTDIIKSVQDIIRIKSVEGAPLQGKPFGEGVNSALMYILSLASSMGFKTRNIDGYIGYAEYGDSPDMIGVIGHIDVVPEGEGWSFPPYEGRISDNKIYGRGASDDKGPVIAALYGLKAVRDLGVPISRKVRIIFGTDEESGWLDVDRYLKDEKAPDAGFTPDGMFPVINAEKGAINIEFRKEISRKSKGMISVKSLNGGEAVNVVPNSCKCELRLKDMAKLMMKDTLELYCQKTKINMSFHEEGDSSIIESGVWAQPALPGNTGPNATILLNALA